MLTSKAVTSVCPKCVTSIKSGKLSCCARGGAWFKNCGDVGDTKFDHTWSEGIQACKGRLSRVSENPNVPCISVMGIIVLLHIAPNFDLSPTVATEAEGMASSTKPVATDYSTVIPVSRAQTPPSISGTLPLLIIE